jgi:3-deoxy-7-phosphoheptulonate synthase
MIEVHPEPDRALCDGPQSLRPSEFAALAATLRALERVIAHEREVTS